MPETLGEAWKLGWRVRLACACGRGDGMKKHPRCTYQTEPSLEHLVLTKGLNFWIDMLPERLMCPSCGGRKFRAMWFPPGSNNEVDVTRPKPVLRRYGTW